MIIAGIHYLVLVMCSAHVCTVNFLYVESLISVKIASFLPENVNGKRPACLGQQEGKLKDLVVAFPITLYYTYISDSNILLQLSSIYIDYLLCCKSLSFNYIKNNSKYLKQQLYNDRQHQVLIFQFQISASCFFL